MHLLKISALTKIAVDSTVANKIKRKSIESMKISHWGVNGVNAAIWYNVNVYMVCNNFKLGFLS